MSAASGDVEEARREVSPSGESEMRSEPALRGERNDRGERRGRRGRRRGRRGGGGGSREPGPGGSNGAGNFPSAGFEPNEEASYSEPVSADVAPPAQANSPAPPTREPETHPAAPAVEHRPVAHFEPTPPIESGPSGSSKQPYVVWSSAPSAPESPPRDNEE